MDREPIFWSTTQSGYNTKDRERDIVVAGRRIKERFPQRGHDGDYEDKKLARHANQRFVRVVRHEGHITPLVLTNAAAHLDTNTDFAGYQKAKMRHFGWFALGMCPLALLAMGDLSTDHFADQSLVKQAPCAPRTYSEAEPCPHCKAETTARRALNAEIELERNASYKDSTEKLIDAQREQTNAQREHNNTMLAGLTEAIKSSKSTK